MKINYKIKLLKIISSSYNSEKSNNLLEKFDIVVLKVNKNFNKIDIKNSIEYLFKLKVKRINTLIVKKKIKKNKNNIIGYTKHWKKAYVFLKPNQNLIYLNKLNEINNENIL